MASVRSKRSPTPEGKGIARARVEGAPPAPWVEGATFDLVGFWVSWHLLGGYEGLRTHLGMSRSAIYRRITHFRNVFGQHPDEYQFPGISLTATHG